MPAAQWKVGFYKDAHGHSPVEEFIDGLPAAEQALCAKVIDLLREMGPALRMPYARKVRGKVWELRPSADRLFYFAHVGGVHHPAWLSQENGQGPGAGDRHCRTAHGRLFGERNMSDARFNDYEEWLAKKLQDPEFRKAYDALEPGFQVARLRMKRGLTQAQLAEMAGTKQPNIARLESGRTSPDLRFLKRVVAALDGCLVLEIGAREEMQSTP